MRILGSGEVTSQDLKRMRLCCGLTQIEVCFGTGISVQRLGQIERGAVQHLECELKSLIRFYQAYWSQLQVAEQVQQALKRESGRMELAAPAT
jgi:transcriptional regulator with XRE-family HTH domain